MNILITGGTGTLGKSLTEYYKSKNKVVIYSRCELKQLQMQNFIDNRDDHIRYFIGDVRDSQRLKTAMQDVDVVIHAAAMKQVPASEYNPMEAVKTNIQGTMNVIHSALDNKVKKVLFISTDKAVNPINLYGATKFSAEKLIINANHYSGWNKTKFSCVRYGNVTGSNGSVLDVFKNSKDLMPITDLSMTRFWMTIKDAVELVNYAIENMNGGEIFIPKMRSYIITTLASAVNENASFKTIGIRDGEKLHESMLNDNDKRNIYDCGKYYCINYGKAKYENKLDSFEYTSDKTEKIGLEEMKELINGI